MSLIIVYFLAVLTVISFSNPSINALKCYECTKLQGENCLSPIDTDRIPSINCRNSSFILNNHDGLEYDCVAYLDRNPRTNDTNIVRKCIIKSPDDYCAIHKQDAELQGLIVESCTHCRKDNCNSSNLLQLNLLIFIVNLFVHLFIKY